VLKIAPVTHLTLRYCFLADQKATPKTARAGKKNSAKPKEPKQKIPERFYIDGGSMNDMSFDDDFDFNLEGAIGGGLKLEELIPVLPNCRICTTCLRPEPQPKTYKKCQK
jgi:hypothetical protein